MHIFIARRGFVVLAAALWLACAGAAGAGTESKCSHVSDSDPSQYELIIKPAVDIHTDRFIGILKDAGVKGCTTAGEAMHVCLATYPKTDPATPPEKAEELMHRGLRPHGNYFEYVLPNAPVRLTQEPPGAHPPGDQNDIGQPELVELGAASAWAKVPTDAQIVTAIIDSGVDLSHPAFAGRVALGQDFTCAYVANKSCQGAPISTNGHGTHMAGIIAARDDSQAVRGVAWNTQFASLRAFDGEESTDFKVGLAIEWASNHHMDVINASWEFDCPLPYALKQIRAAARNGVLFVTAAGNGGQHVGPGQKVLYPQIYGGENMIVVMGHDRAMKRWSVSDWGTPPVDIAAPGTALTTGDSSTGDCVSDEACYSEQGPSTSDATAYVAGAAALLKSVHPSWTASWLKLQLLESAISEPSLQGMSSHGARLMLDRALHGPIEPWMPAWGTRWSSSQAQKVAWSNDYPSQLCTGVTVAVQLGDSAYVDVATNQPNTGSVSVRLPAVSTATPAVLRLTCSPGGISVLTPEFTVIP